MRKKILFIISNMETGGVSKSMTSLMNAIDRQRYDVSLLIVSPHGPLMELLPKDLQIVRNPIFEALTCRLSGFKTLIKMGKPLLAMAHLLRLALSMVCRWRGVIFMAKLAPGLTEEYDAIVDFNGQQQLYYMVDKLKAKRKITFFHSDYKKWRYYEKADRKYFAKVDAIFTISDICVDSLKDVFPEYSDKIYKMENIVLPSLIKQMAMRQIPHSFDKSILNLVSIGHLLQTKGIDFAIEAAQILKNNGIKFLWTWVGAIAEPQWVETITQRGLSEYFRFIGTTSNPYPYLNAADIIVHPSRFEGKSIALDEAKILCKPIVVTDFSTVHDQFTDGVNASICEMNGTAVADAILNLIHNPEIAQRYVSNLSQCDFSNIKELDKLINML
jgi:glycosyltransferase involved in cell wall biosynthesis